MYTIAIYRRGYQRGLLSFTICTKASIVIAGKDVNLHGAARSELDRDARNYLVARHFDVLTKS